LVIKIRGSSGSTGMGGGVGVVHSVGDEGRSRCDYGAPLHLFAPYPRSQQNSDWKGSWNGSLSLPDKGVSKTKDSRRK